VWDPQRKRLVWSSEERPATFVAGERITVQPGTCVQWTLVWAVRAAGSPIRVGTYEFRWTAGTGMSTATGTADRQTQPVKVAAR
jgi:hypothetical protein